MSVTFSTLGDLDELDRRIIAALQMDGRASWTGVAELVGTSVATVARRAPQLLATGIVRVAVVPDISHAGPADLFVLKIRCDPGATTAVAYQLARRNDVRFLAVVTGSADIVAELVVLKSDSLHTRIIEEVQAISGVRSCESDLVLHTYKMAHDWSRQLLNGEKHSLPTGEPHECEPGHFDDVDHAMLALLLGDGRAGFRTIANALGVNESTVRRRFEALLARGCVSVVTLVPAAALGFESEILFMISVAPASLDAVARELAIYRGVRYAAATLGSSALMCEVILPTIQDVFRFTNGILGRLDGVQGWTAGVELLTYKRGFVLTPWSCPTSPAVGASDDWAASARR